MDTSEHSLDGSLSCEPKTKQQWEFWADQTSPLQKARELRCCCQVTGAEPQQWALTADAFEVHLFVKSTFNKNWIFLQCVSGMMQSIKDTGEKNDYRWRIWKVGREGLWCVSISESEPCFYHFFSEMVGYLNSFELSFSIFKIRVYTRWCLMLLFLWFIWNY